MALQWLIVGGGIHGVHLAARLLAEGGVAREDLRLLDPAPRLLDNWRRCTANTGMRHLRSPAVHHLALDPWSLVQFAEVDPIHFGGLQEHFAPPYGRPALDLFAAHCDEVIRTHGLTDLHVRDRACRIDLRGDEARVELESGDAITTRRVLLAVGAGAQPRWPDWARRLAELGHRVQHVFEPGFELVPDEWPNRVAVIGGGISGAQAAMRLGDGRRTVHLISRHAARVHQFDSDPGWLGPKHMRTFQATESLEQRRAMITEARHVGSVPPDVHEALHEAVQAGRVRVRLGDASPAAHGPPTTLQVGDEALEVDAVLLATGFEGARPGGALVDHLIQAHALPCAACGYPVVDEHLRWHPAVFVTGPLAELEVGPASRNIAGARQAADRIVRAARAS